MAFPTKLSCELVPLAEVTLDGRGREAQIYLQTRDLEVMAGLRPQDVQDIRAIASEPNVRTFCPNDSHKFNNSVVINDWMESRQGRGMFLLRTIGEKSIVGYGWTGPHACPELPNCETTFAIRLSCVAAGQRLATPFTAAILSGSKALFDAANIGLDCYKSNERAHRAYARAGAEPVTEKPVRRPTLTPPYSVEDQRLYMQFLHTFK